MPGIMSSPSSNNSDNDAWLMKTELKREEPMEINKDEGIKKAMEDQTLTAEEENIPQPLPNLFTPTEIEAFKMIELARIQNKYLTRENILLKVHINSHSRALSTSWKSSYARCATIHHHLLHQQRRHSRHSPWQLPSLGEVPWYRITITLLSLPFFLVRSY